MNLVKVINLLFPNFSRKEKGEIFQKIFIPQIPTIINIVALDEEIIRYFGEYEGSMEDRVKKLLGGEGALEIRKLLTSQ